MEYKGYQIYTPTSGGKAGKGYNKTSTLQVRKPVNSTHCEVVFKMKFKVTASRADYVKAIGKCREFIDNELDKHENNR